MNHFEAIEKLLTRGGWKPVRTCGNLRQYKKAGNPASLVLPVPEDAPLPEALVRHLETLQDYPFGVSPVFSPP